MYEIAEVKGSKIQGFYSIMQHNTQSTMLLSLMLPGM